MQCAHTPTVAFVCSYQTSGTLTATVFFPKCRKAGVLMPPSYWSPLVPLRGPLSEPLSSDPPLSLANTKSVSSHIPCKYIEHSVPLSVIPLSVAEGDPIHVQPKQLGTCPILKRAYCRNCACLNGREDFVNSRSLQPAQHHTNARSYASTSAYPRSFRALDDRR